MRIRLAALVLLVLSVSVLSCTPRELAPIVAAGTVLLSGECTLLEDSGADPWVTLLCPLVGGGQARVRITRVAWGASRADLDAGPGK